MTKIKLTDVLTINEAAERYGINKETLKNKLKPSIAGADKIAKWTEEGLIRKSSNIWLLTTKFVEQNVLNN